MDYIEPFTFNAIRFLLGGVVLLPLIALRSRRERGTETGDKKLLWKGGILCGIVLCIASAFQQLGIQGTTVGKTGFITALYIVLVPVFGCVPAQKSRNQTVAQCTGGNFRFVSFVYECRAFFHQPL